MRNFFLLALMGFSFLFTGCGAVRTVANNLHNDICVTSYNMLVCPDTSTSEAPAPRTRLCYGVSVRTVGGVNNYAHTDQGVECNKLQREATRKAFDSKPGTTCTIEGKGLDQQVVCAGLNGPIVLAFFLLLIIGRKFPSTKVACGLIAMVIGVMTCVNSSNADAACINPKLMPALVKVSTGINLSGESVEVKMPRIVSIIVNKCVLETSQDLDALEAQEKEIAKAYDVLAGPSAAMVNYCTTLRGTDNIGACFEQEKEAEKALNLLVKKAQDLYWARYNKAEEEKRAAKKAAQDKATKELLEEGNKQLEEGRKMLESLKGLNDLVVQEGSCGGFLIVVLYGLLGLLGGCRSRLLIILITLGSTTALADAAAKNGCSLASDESVIELFSGSCSAEVLESLIEEVGLVCTEEHRMEGAFLSMDAPTEQGLSKEADLRHRFLEALCWSEAGFGWAAIWALLLGLFRGKTTYMVPAQIKNNAIIEVGKEKFVLDCHVIIFTIRDSKKKSYDGKDKVVGRRFSALAPDGRRYVKDGHKGYFRKEGVS